MVTGVSETLRRKRESGDGALIGYLPLGFPTIDESVDAAIGIARSGVDVLELGVPYSDPVMDGPVIQAATQRALLNGFRLFHIFEAVRRITSECDANVLLMTYWNPVVQYGVERFADDLLDAGGSGLITPDLIPDEAVDWIAASERTGLDRVFLAAPSSNDARLAQAVESSRGFVYTVSTMGITGARTDVDAAARTLVSRLRDAGVENACVGLGISTPEQVREVLEYADGAIVGSALVKALGDGGVDAVSALAAQLASGTTRTRKNLKGSW
ncbi:tryptophan synthase subunit alpha [Paramicrobacterium chengjingii]|uniref:tryptophan synthase subunit alpha n=1 Tax=Paramicrobacterium chengjingii TaxID=2769067 RepID=UPI003D9C73FB